MKNQPTKIIDYSADIESALYEITELGINCDSMEEYYEKTHAIVKRLTYAENFFIALYDQETKGVKFVYFVDEVDTNLNIENLKILTQDDLKKSATAYLMQSGDLLHLDAKKQSELDEAGILEMHGSPPIDWLGVPLKHKDELLGAMVIQSYDREITYGTKEENILQFISRQIALLIKTKSSEQELIEANKLLESRVKDRTDSLNRINFILSNEVEDRKTSEKIQAALFKITDLVSTTSGLADFFKNVHEVIAGLMFAKNLYIALMTDNDKYIEFVYHVDQKDLKPEKRPMSEGNVKISLTERILINGDVILLNRIPDDGNAVSGSECASYLGVPLVDNNRNFGVLAIQSYQQDIIYNQTHKEVLITIGKQIATAILRKKDADSLKAAHESLERRVKERTSELERTIEKRRKIEEQLEHDSLHDALTKLPNRLYFSKVLAEQLANGKQSLDEGFSVLFLDLDRFKVINDSLGHHIGDLFLIEVARRLTHCLRGDDVVARLGGDEFCILMRGIDNAATAIGLASRILKDLKEPVVVDKHSLITSASIGIRMADSITSTAEEIMSDADAAMYRAKHQGKNCFCVFDAEIKQLVTGRMAMENDLREAIANSELYLVFQPVFDMASRKIVGCEALIRWEHPIKGFIPPDEFIPIAEETGVIVELGEFVTEQAIAAIKIMSKNVKTNQLFVNINVSTVQILTRTFDIFLRDAIAENNIDPELLNVEITESILIEDYSAAINFVREAKSMGVKIYLDDFGTGFSSLSYLHQFPFDVIKLDKSFIDAMKEGERNKAIVQSISSMARNLDMKIVAEGVETEDQLQQLQEYDYTFGQGYYFAKPMALRDLIKFASTTSEQE